MQTLSPLENPSTLTAVYTVSQLNIEARLLLESHFKTLWITGEISNLSRPSSGHWYFSLKDEQAQVRCAFFRNHQRRLNFIPENGLQVLLKAQISLYETRGDYQLIIHHMEIAGIGALQLAFEQLKKRLTKEGLFADKYKKTFPVIPHCIGVVTSPTGAAIRDILQILNRRFPSIKVIIYPTVVQGEKAATQIVSAIEVANQRKECAVILLARGGGSLEDLWPFNEEIVARAIFASNIPIITGIGHETDFTIADFVADQRAATPSAAAALLSPDVHEYLKKINVFSQRFQQLFTSSLKYRQLQLQNLYQRLQHPGQALQNFAQRLAQLAHRLLITLQHHLQQQEQKLSQAAQALHTLSPLATLQRGYAILQHHETQQIIRKNNDVQTGDLITAKLAQGDLVCRVEKNLPVGCFVERNRKHERQ